jgi:hypothetical protein
MTQKSKKHFISFILFCLTCFPFQIQADPPTDSQSIDQNSGRKQRPLPVRILYWLGAGIAMLIVARKVFQEQFHERTVIRKLSDQIGPFYREFDPINLHRWVDRAAPYFFNALIHKDMTPLAPFAEPAFIEYWQNHFTHAQSVQSQSNPEMLVLSKILKVHPIGVYPTIEKTAPLGVEVVLRVEIKVLAHTTQNEVKKTTEKQIQYLWTLKHDGHHWQIKEIREIFDDVIGLNEKPGLPPLLDWAPPTQYKKETIAQIDALDEQQIS